jgi:cytochrome c5
MNASAAAGISGAAAPAKDDGEPTWSNIFTYDFRSCRVVNCHGGGTAGVDMTSKDAAWDSLVHQPANPKGMCAQLGKERIVPGQPDESLLYLKLDINAPCGQQMPAGGQLSQKARDRIKTWIEMGAAKE